MNKNVSSKVITAFIIVVLLTAIVLFFDGVITENNSLCIKGYITWGVGVLLAIKYVIATCFYSVANEKEFYEARYLWIPFLFSFVGYILVAALPDRHGISKSYIDNKIDAIDNLKKLLDVGVVTQEEFDAKKKQILGL